MIMPPILRTEGIVRQLGKHIIPACVPIVVDGMFRPSDVDFGMVKVLSAVVATAGERCVDGIKGILNVAPILSIVA